MSDSAKAIFEMLSFQYKPVEKAFIKILNKGLEGKELIKKYKTGSYAQKIMMLDRFVAFNAVGGGW